MIEIINELHEKILAKWIYIDNRKIVSLNNINEIFNEIRGRFEAQVIKHGYHVTTERKLERYKQTKGILPPVRFFPNKETAERWKTRTGRQIILEIDYKEAHPLPDHKPALWTNEFVTEYRRAL